MRSPSVAEQGDPVTIVVGDDAPALNTAQELCMLGGHRVVVLWHGPPDFVRAVECLGAVFITLTRMAKKVSAAPGYDKRSRSSRCRPTISSICVPRCQSRQPHRAAAIKSDACPQARAKPAELLGVVARLAFGCDLRRGRNRSLLLSRAAISAAGRAADRICEPDRGGLRGRRRHGRSGRRGARRTDYRRRWRHRFSARHGPTRLGGARRVQRGRAAVG